MNKLQHIIADLCEAYMMAQIEKGGTFQFSEDTQAITAATHGLIRRLSMLSDSEIVAEVRKLNQMIK